MNDPHHAAHTLPKTLPKILVLAWHKEEWKGCISQFPEPVCGVITVPLATYKKKVSIHWPSYCGSEQKIFSSTSDLNLNIFSSGNLTQSIITFEVKKVTVIYMYICAWFHLDLFLCPVQLFDSLSVQILIVGLALWEGNMGQILDSD